MSDVSPAVLVVAGTTASGKTGAAIELARRLGGELIGCDSVQVSRGFDIGSAKATPAELGGIAHHLVDVIDPDEEIDAARYASLADAAIAELDARGKIAIVVGGTGLWQRALLRGLVDLPAPDAVIRARLEEEARTLGTAALHARLREIDPRAASAIHENDELRIVRALEVFEQTGRPLGELRAEHALGAPRYPYLHVALDLPRDELYARIDARIDTMIAAGWLDEARALLARWGPDVRPFGSVGYRELRDHLVHGVPWDETVQHVRKSTRVYTRRQRTWLGNEPDVAWRTDAKTLLSPEGEARIRAFFTEHAR
ncbi:tRNA (adenosine(37)-N6)-dimethylallyltransferase MiaA [Sandaracinus amylolyticus]|uniref:tRNA (adenosine(37)-N6)-dimethylallyltransferase MiaA n=1 Tax=Sandaracinus amylolyticus TaxID=927083 RepID=UPI001EFF6BE6|nr:tRNA (adenosine(37)-N6)-dimethylallyltransferase MiaA [Sandaracinus amylolyticus]UJR79397.1 tRNA dimethylallyltransferase [Sandaracinus amylolyticus]